MFLACVQSRRWQDPCCPRAPIGCSSTPCSEKPSPAHAPSASLKHCECRVLWDLHVCFLRQDGICISDVNKRFTQWLSACTKCRAGPCLLCWWGREDLCSFVCWHLFPMLWRGWLSARWDGCPALRFHVMLPGEGCAPPPGTVVVKHAGSLREGSCPPCKQPGGLQGPACLSSAFCSVWCLLPPSQCSGSRGRWGRSQRGSLKLF